jgi:hypothetical protein
VAGFGLVALPAIDLDGGEGMTAFTETILTKYRTGRLAGVTVNTTDETRFLATNTLAQTAVALMTKHVHVIQAHFLGRGNTLTGPFNLHHRLGHASGMSRK